MGRVVKIDFTGVESGGSRNVVVPEGDYALEIVDIKGKKGQESDKPVLWFTFELSKGPKRGNGKRIQHSCSLQKQALWNLRNILEACGKTVPSKPVKLNIDGLIGLKCAGSTVDSEYEGRKRSEIAVFFPLDSLGKTSDGDELEEEVEEAEEKPSKKGKKASKKKGGDEDMFEAGEEGEETEEKEEAEEEETDDLFS